MRTLSKKAREGWKIEGSYVCISGCGIIVDTVGVKCLSCEHREINREIAEFMRYTHIPQPDCDNVFSGRIKFTNGTKDDATFFFAPTLEIQDAFMVMEKMKGNREFIRLLMASYHSGGSLFDSIVSFFKDPEAPMAICLAVLKTLKEKKEVKRDGKEAT